MTSKDVQSAFIKTYLKPLLKQYNYLVNGQTWWKERDEFYTVINLQNFSWNHKDEVSFCFNIGIALKATVKNTQKVSYADLTVQTREGNYLPDDRNIHLYRNTTGYAIKQNTELTLFTEELKIDFEQYILPALEQLNTLNNCLSYYEQIPFWGDHLKNKITELALKV